MKRNSITILRVLFLIFGIQILFGKSPTGALKTASFLEKRGEFENAISIYTGILDDDPKNTQAYRKLKTLYKRLEQYPPLLLLIQEHCNLFPNDLQSYGELGETEFLNKNTKGAEDIWDDLEMRFGNSQNAYRILMYIFSRLSLPEKMETVVKRGRERLQSPALLSLDLANYYKTRRIFDKATDEFLLYYIYNPRQKKMITDRILHMSDEEDARSIIEEKIQNKIEQNELSMRPLAASFYFKTREYSRAFDQHLTLGINTHADFIRWIDFANNLRQEGRYELAITSYESLLSPGLEIKNPKIIGQALLGIGLTFEDKIIPSQKNNSLIQYFPENEFFENHFYENQHLSITSLETAFQFYDSLLTHIPASSFSASAHFRLGEIQFRITRDFDGASRSYDAALRSNPSAKQERDIRLRIGDLLLAKGDIPSALTYFEHERSRGIEFLNRLIRVNFLAGNPDSVVKLIDSGLGILRPDADSFNDILELRDFIQQHYLFGSQDDKEAFKMFAASEFLTYQNKLTEATKLLQYIREQFPQSSIISKTILREALIHNTMAQTSSALSLAEKLTQTPDADIGWVLYAEILEKSENNPKKALEFYHKFLEEFPSSLLYEPVRFHVRELQDQLKS